MKIVFWVMICIYLKLDFFIFFLHYEKHNFYIPWLILKRYGEKCFLSDGLYSFKSELLMFSLQYEIHKFCFVIIELWCVIFKTIFLRFLWSGTCFRIQSPRSQSPQETKYNSGIFSVTFYLIHEMSLGKIHPWDTKCKSMPCWRFWK